MNDIKDFQDRVAALPDTADETDVLALIAGMASQRTLDALALARQQKSYKLRLKIEMILNAYNAAQQQMDRPHLIIESAVPTSEQDIAFRAWYSDLLANQKLAQRKTTTVARRRTRSAAKVAA